MYTILVTDDNELITSVKERIMQRSKLVDSFHFLVPQTYKELNMTDFMVYMEYILPSSKELHSEILALSDELYKEKLEYKLPFDTTLTKEHGDIEVQLTFIKVELDSEGNNIQYVRKTSPTSIQITPISAWSDIIPDYALGAVENTLLQLDGKLKELEEISRIYDDSKADNIALDIDHHQLYLTAKGNAIGKKIALGELGDAVADAAEDGLITVIL